MKSVRPFLRPWPLLPVIGVLFASPAPGGLSQWTGGAGGNAPRFSDRRNWLNGSVPATGDALIVSGNSGADRAMNDLPDRTFLSLRFTNDFEALFADASKPELRVEGALIAQHSTANDLSLAPEVDVDPKVVIVTGDAPTQIKAELGARLLLNGGVQLGNDVIFRSESRADQPVGRQHASIIVSGSIEGPGAIAVETSQVGDIAAAGSVSFRGSHPFTGTLTVRSGGQLNILAPGGLGSTQQGTVVDAGGRLRITAENALSIAELLQLNGELHTAERFPGSNVTQTVTLTGPVIREQSGRWVLGCPLSVTGVMKGAGAHDVQGAGQVLRLSGPEPNTFTGSFTTTADLVLDKKAGVTAVPGALTVKAGANVRWSGDEQVGDGAALTLNAATASLDGRQETVGQLIMEADPCLVDTDGGSLRVNTGILCRRTAVARIEGIGADANLLPGLPSSELNVDPGSNLTIDAGAAPAVAGARFRKIGGGAVRIEGSGTWSVPLTIAGGTVLMDKTTTVPVTLDRTVEFTEAALAGSGRVGAVTAVRRGGFVSPGNRGRAGTLACGNLTLSAECAMVAQIEGSVVADLHDQLIVTGSVDLGTADLILTTSGITTFPGTSIMLIDNDGTDAITGTFAGLPQGATLPGGRFTISYTGGTGNDVVLVATVQPSGVTRTWTGASGTSDLWSTASNWSPAGAPQDGDVLVFPPSANRRTTNINNLPSLAVQSLRFSGGNYKLSGNPLSVGAGIQVSGPVMETHEIGMDLSLAGPQTISTGSHFLILNGDIDTNGQNLTFQCQGPPGTTRITCAGIISEGNGDQLLKTGSGPLLLGGNNTFGGNLHIAAGEVILTHEKGVGNSSGHTTVAEGAVLTLAGTAAVLNLREPLFLDGTLRVADQSGTTNIVDQHVRCGAAATIQVSATGVSQCNIVAPVGGLALRKTGPGVLVFSSVFVVEFLTGITVAEGILKVGGSAGVVKLSGTTTVGTSTTPATLEILQDNVMELDGRLEVNPGSTVQLRSPSGSSSEVMVELGGVDLRGGTITGTRPFGLTGPLRSFASGAPSVIDVPVHLAPGTHVWTVEDGAAAVDLRVTGPIEESGDIAPDLVTTILEKAGAGRADFLSSQPIGRPDALRIAAGHCHWSGNTPGMNVEVNGGTFGGTPVVGTMAGSGGIVAPGASPGILSAAFLKVPAVTMQFELSGTAPGTGYDQIRIAAGGTGCDLSRAGLQVSLPNPAAFTPAPGTVFTIIEVQGSGPPVPFANLPEGSLLFGGAWDRRYRLSYLGGSGNDVTLTTLAGAPPPVLGLSGVDVTIDPVTGTRILLGSVSGGPGAAGLNLRIESSTDLRVWRSLASVTADADGNAPFAAFSPATQPAQFIRARFP